MLDSIPEQLVRYYGQLLHGDLGESRRIQSGQPVTTVIGQRFVVSMRVGVISLCISLVIGVIMGIIQARHKDKVPDHIGTAYTIFVNAVPPLVSYSLILIFGAMVLDIPATYSTRNPGMSSILPIVCLALASIAGYALWTRRYMVDEINKDYIKLARVKGMSYQEYYGKTCPEKRVCSAGAVSAGFFPSDHRRFSAGREIFLCSGYGSAADGRDRKNGYKRRSGSGYPLRKRWVLSESSSAIS